MLATLAVYLAAGTPCAPQPLSGARFVGSVRLPVEYQAEHVLRQLPLDVMNCGVALCAFSALSFTYGDYADFVPPGKRMYMRLCVSWVDGGGTVGDLLHLRLLDQAPFGSKTYYQARFPAGVQDEAISQQQCADSDDAALGIVEGWKLVDDIACGPAPLASCAVAADYQSEVEKPIRLRINHAWLELVAR